MPEDEHADNQAVQDRVGHERGEDRGGERGDHPYGHQQEDHHANEIALGFGHRLDVGACHVCCTLFSVTDE